MHDSLIAEQSGIIEEKGVFLQMQLTTFLEKARSTEADWQALCASIEIEPRSCNDRAISQWLCHLETKDGYQQYRASPLWDHIRAAVITRDKYQCSVCKKKHYAGRKRLYDKRHFEVHHRAYDYATMAGESLEQLITVCRRCHRIIHYSSSGEKIPQNQWTDREEFLRSKLSKQRTSVEIKRKRLTALRNQING